MTLFRDGEFRSHSGLMLPFKIECDALGPEDWATVARQVADHGAFRIVVGIPHGGLAFAAALQRYADPSSLVVLIVDDVYTSGNSMREHRARMIDSGVPAEQIRGVVLFARSEPDDWVTPMFRLCVGR